MKLLEVAGLCAGYGRSEVLHSASFHIDEGEIVVMLGVNGAGKTTTLRALSGLVASSRGRITFAGQSIRGLAPEAVVARGIAHVPEGRGTFADFTVRENLLLGAWFRRDRAEVTRDIASWETFFPILRERREQHAGTLSGGEQQMLAVARALMSRPRLLLLDEPSQGLAPLVIRELFGRLHELNRERGTTMFIVEQNARLSLDMAHRAYVLQSGEIATSGSAAEMRDDENVRRAYLGV
jgi:branched-chain amino acid transport system ATP-binding protein